MRHHRAGEKPEEGGRVMRAWQIWELLQEPIIGYEEDDDSNDDSGDEDDDSGSEEEEEEEDSEDEDDEEEDDPDKKAEGKKDTAGLKSALQKERTDCRKAERELKKLQKQQARQKAEEDDELKATQDENKVLKDANAKLAEGFLRTKLDSLIIKHATKAKFRDVDDAISGVKLDEIDFDQDEDDPSDLEIDEDSVAAAVKALAKKKPHFVLADGEEEPSGSRFGGKKTGKKDEADEEALRDKYSALRRGKPRDLTSTS